MDRARKRMSLPTDGPTLLQANYSSGELRVLNERTWDGDKGGSIYAESQSFALPAIPQPG